MSGTSRSATPRVSLHKTWPQPERAYLMAVEVKGRDGWNAESSLDELAQLADTAGAEVVGHSIQRREHPDSNQYVGKGKLAEIIAERADLNYDVLIVDDELTPTQQRHLEETSDVKVIDRTALILDIFARRARTREGRLQVELAQLEYLLPRLAGQWSHLERLGGGIGTRGPGETQLETDRRLIRGRIGHLNSQIEQIRRHRSLYRRNRARQGIAVVALVGYTNAGKSTLMNRLSRSDIPAEDRLFETLDPVTRRVELTPDCSVLLTDTVGFIQKLPTQLVAAFRATLEELEDAALLLHVIDVTHPNAAEQSDAVERTLDNLGLASKPRLELLNKVDRLAPRNGQQLHGLADLADLRAGLRADRPDAVLISAVEGWGIDELRAQMLAVLARLEPNRKS